MYQSYNGDFYLSVGEFALAESFAESFYERIVKTPHKYYPPEKQHYSPKNDFACKITSDIHGSILSSIHSFRAVSKCISKHPNVISQKIGTKKHASHADNLSQDDKGEQPE